MLSNDLKGRGQKRMDGRKKHILVVSQYFYPEQFRINDLCREWVRRGYKVTVVTGIPNYPGGSFYSGYGWIKKRKEEYEGIEIIRLPLIPRGKNNFMLFLNYISFVVSGAIWSQLTRVKTDTVFIFEVSPMTQALVGVWYGKRKKLPCCIYVQDLWPENVEVVTGIRNKYIIKGINRMVDYIYRNCEYIFATSPSFVNRIEERRTAFCNGKSKAIYWPQYAEEFYKPVSREELGEIKSNEIFKIIFTGNIGYAQGLEILPETATLLKSQGISCEFYIIGDGRYRAELEKSIKEHEVDEMFSLLGRKEPEQIPKYMACCDAAFLSFADNPLFQMTIPAKLQSYMACGIPIVAAASGETKRIIEEAEAGIVCEIGVANALAEGIRWMMEQPEKARKKMGEHAREYYKREFNRDFLLKVMEEYLKG